MSMTWRSLGHSSLLIILWTHLMMMMIMTRMMMMTLRSIVQCTLLITLWTRLSRPLAMCDWIASHSLKGTKEELWGGGEMCGNQHSVVSSLLASGHSQVCKFVSGYNIYIHTYNHKRWRERWHNHKRWRRSNQITLTRELTVVWRAWLRLRCTLHTCNHERCVEGWRWQRNHFDSRIDSWLSRAVNCQSPTTNQFRPSLNLQDSLNSNYQLL